MLEITICARFEFPRVRDSHQNVLANTVSAPICHNIDVVGTFEIAQPASVVHAQIFIDPVLTR